MRKGQYYYETCCINSTAEQIDAMTDTAREVTLATVRRHVADLASWIEGQGYASRKRQGLTLANDYHVSYYRSTYAGRPCYYIVHSCIEYIFTMREDQGAYC